MENLSYQLRIDAEEKNYEKISSIIGLKPENYRFGWLYELIFEEQEKNFDILEKFLCFLEGKYSQLQELGIETEDITIWLIYGYNNQCNMEFEPKNLEQLGKRGIKLCISCYEAGE